MEALPRILANFQGAEEGCVMPSRSPQQLPSCCPHAALKLPSLKQPSQDTSRTAIESPSQTVIPFSSQGRNANPSNLDDPRCLLVASSVLQGAACAKTAQSSERTVSVFWQCRRIHAHASDAPTRGVSTKGTDSLPAPCRTAHLATTCKGALPLRGTHYNRRKLHSR